MTLREMLKKDQENGNIILGIAISGRVSDKIGELSTYSSISGSFIDGIYQWMTHYVDGWNEVSNKKYTGYVLYAKGKEYKFVIENYFMDLQVKDWKHAKNMFHKYLRTV